MATELNQMIREALELSDEDRAFLAGLLIKSLESEADSEADIEEAWLVEAERRWNEIEAGKVSTVPWNEVRAKLLKQ
jgi:putative addiction module component (TIGR02574 family)